MSFDDFDFVGDMMAFYGNRVDMWKKRLIARFDDVDENWVAGAFYEKLYEHFFRGFPIDSEGNVTDERHLADPKHPDPDHPKDLIRKAEERMIEIARTKASRWSYGEKAGDVSQENDDASQGLDLEMDYEEVASKLRGFPDSNRDYKKEARKFKGFVRDLYNNLFVFIDTWGFEDKIIEAYEEYHRSEVVDQTLLDKNKAFIAYSVVMNILSGREKWKEDAYGFLFVAIQNVIRAEINKSDDTISTSDMSDVPEDDNRGDDDSASDSDTDNSENEDSDSDNDTDNSENEDSDSDNDNSEDEDSDSDTDNSENEDSDSDTDNSENEDSDSDNDIWEYDGYNTEDDDSKTDNGDSDDDLVLQPPEVSNTDTDRIFDVYGGFTKRIVQTIFPEFEILVWTKYTLKHYYLSHFKGADPITRTAGQLNIGKGSLESDCSARKKDMFKYFKKMLGFDNDNPQNDMQQNGKRKKGKRQNVQRQDDMRKFFDDLFYENYLEMIIKSRKSKDGSVNQNDVVDIEEEYEKYLEIILGKIIDQFICQPIIKLWTDFADKSGRLVLDLNKDELLAEAKAFSNILEGLEYNLSAIEDSEQIEMTNFLTWICSAHEETLKLEEEFPSSEKASQTTEKASQTTEKASQTTGKTLKWAEVKLSILEWTIVAIINKRYVRCVSNINEYISETFNVTTDAINTIMSKYKTLIEYLSKSESLKSSMMRDLDKKVVTHYLDNIFGKIQQELIVLTVITDRNMNDLDKEEFISQVVDFFRPYLE